MDKTQIMFCGTSRILDINKLRFTELYSLMDWDVDESIICAKTLGVTLDCSFKFEKKNDSNHL